MSLVMHLTPKITNVGLNNGGQRLPKRVTVTAAKKIFDSEIIIYEVQLTLAIEVE